MQTMDFTWIIKKLTEVGSTQKKLAEFMDIEAQKLHQSIHNRRKFAPAELMALAEFFNTTVDSILKGTVDISAGKYKVPVVGWLDKNETIHFFETGSDMEAVEVTASTLDLRDSTAIELRSDFKEGILQNEGGFAIIGRKISGVPKEFIGRTVGVKVQGGITTIKKVLPGSGLGLYTLRSKNEKLEDLRDQEIEWTAPILCYVPKPYE